MHRLIEGIRFVLHAISSALKKGLNGIKKALVTLLKPIGVFFLAVARKVFSFFKVLLLYLIIKPILFVYHHIVTPFGHFLGWVGNGIKKIILQPIFYAIKKLFYWIFLFFKTIFCFIWHKILVPIGRFIRLISMKIGQALHFIFHHIYLFFKTIFCFIWNRIFVPIGRFFRFIFRKLGKALHCMFHYIYLFFKTILCFIWNKILTPIGRFFHFIFEKIGQAIDLIFHYIYLFFKTIFCFIWDKILAPIGRFIRFIFRKLGQALRFIFHYVYLFFYYICKFIYYKIILPFFHFLKFIFQHIYHFLVWLVDHLIHFLTKLGIKIWHVLKFIYQMLSSIIVISISSVGFVIYIILVYPFRIIFVETKCLVQNDSPSFSQKLWFHPFYLFQLIKTKNCHQREKMDADKKELSIFIQIKNIIAIPLSILFITMFYPMNWLMILVYKIMIRKY